MNRFLVFLLGGLLGVVLGGVLTFYFFVITPQRAQVPGQPIQPPDSGGLPSGTAQIVLRQDIFNEILGTIFRDMNAPEFPLNVSAQKNLGNGEFVKTALALQNQCTGNITILPEGSGIQSGFRFDNNKISAPLAFRGSTSVFGNCINFQGWAQTNLELRYNAENQNVLGQINVETVNLEGLSPIVSGLVTPIVQGTLNQRVNPVQIIKGEQIALNLPIAATKSNLQAVVKDVRSEVKENALYLYVIYDFKGIPQQ